MRNNTLCLFEVVRADPDKDYYLLRLFDTGIINDLYCVMKKTHAVRKYVPGDFLMATFTNRSLGKYKEVSQKIPAHVINVLKLFIPEEERKAIDTFFSRVGGLNRASVCKVGVWGKAGLLSPKELNEKLRPYLKEVKEYIPSPIFIPSSALKENEDHTPPERFLLNALYPAPLEKVEGFRFDPFSRIFEVYLSEKILPLFLWKDYINIKLAAKMTKTAYKLIVIETNQKIVVDPYRLTEEKGGEEDEWRNI